MKPALKVRALRYFNPVCGGRIFIVALLAAGFAARCDAIEIVAIEEHWSLEIGAPDAASSAPQVSMAMSPYGGLSSVFFVFTLNHRNDPTFTAGGMQVQRWTGGDLQSSRTGVHTTPLAVDQETVSWVQRMELTEGQLRFEVNNGASSSWGAFGSEGNLRISTPTELTNLNLYLPYTSLTQSGVCFAGNRVKSLTLTKLRWIDSEGQEYELQAPIDVDADLDP
ncbi:MAG: hypothetical protein KDA61_22450 [Planctomycetales bacterium]|nr:hypothetical protein [Planctomycetales bacterium]